MHKTTIKSRPILFSMPMVKAILAGTKAQTRRVIKPQPIKESFMAANFETAKGGEVWQWRKTDRTDCSLAESFICPFGKVGDVLYVRETWRLVDFTNPYGDDWTAIVQFKDLSFGQRISVTPDERIGWRSSIHLPKHLSRITLDIEDIRVERLQDISREDVYAEGVSEDEIGIGSEKNAFANLWNEINGKREGCSWAENPFVWCLEFKKV